MHLDRVDRTDEPVGRAAELDLIESRLAGRVSVAVGGQAGVGKTHLARVVAARVRATGAPVEWITGATGRSRTPFGAVLRLLPLDDLPASDDFVARDAHMIRRAVAALSRDTSRLIVADDVHLFDDWSALLVQSLVLDGHVAVIMTLRSGESVPASLSVLWKDRLAERVDLLPLGAGEVVALASRLLGGAISESAGSWLAAESGGNPLLLAGLVADARDSDDLTLVEDEWQWSGCVGAGRRLQDVITERLRTAGEDDIGALGALAQAEPLRAGTLHELVPGWDLARGETRGLVTVTGRGVAAEVRLAHPLFGELALGLLTPDARGALPRRIADILATSGDHTEEARIVEARLRLESGDHTRPDLFATAAADAVRMGAAAFALELLDAIQAPATVDPALRIQALIHSGDYATATDAMFERLDHPDLSDSDRVAVFQGIVHTARMLDEPERVDGAYALAGAHIEDPSWTAILDATRLQTEMMAGRTRAATARAEAVLAEHPDDPRLRVRLVSSVGSGRSLAGRNDAALAFVGEALSDALRLQAELPLGPTWALNAQALALLLAGHLPEAADFIATVRTLTSDDPAAGPWLDLFAGRVDLARGRAAAAAEQLRRAADAFGDDDIGGFHRWARSLEAEALALAGQVGPARVAAARAESSRSRMPLYEPDAERARCWVIALGGELTRAVDELRGIADAHVREEQFGLAIHAQHDAIRLGATEMRAELGRALEAVDGRWSIAFARDLDAVTSGRGADWATAADAYLDVGATLHAAEALTLAARSFEAERLQARAAASSRRRAELLAECGPVHSPRLADAPDRAHLTRREREIAMLAASGLSNAEIADRLFISVRTAEGHLYRASTKLGVTSRDEIGGALGTAPNA